MSRISSVLGLLFFFLFCLLAHPASAALTITAQPSAATAGGGGFFDVTLTNSGATSYPVDNFIFELTVPSASGITFTNVDTNTSIAEPYIFNGSSYAGGVGITSSSFPTTDVNAGDNSTNANGVTVSIGNTYALGRVYYSVAPGTALGIVPVSFAPAGTSLADANFNTIPATLQNGAITVASASAAPEPSEMGMMILMASILGGLLLRARRFRQH